MKTKKAKFERVTGRIVANTGNFAVCELTSGNYSVVARGYDGFEDMFDTDFKATLPVGMRVMCAEYENGVRFLNALEGVQ